MNIPFHTAWRISVLSVLMLIVVRMAPPFSWTQTQFLFSYDAGFQRRALLGEILTWIFPQGITQQNSYVVAALITLVAVVALFNYVTRSFSQLPNGGVLLILFSFSVGLGVFIGNTGNLDGIILTLAILALSVPKDTALRLGVVSLICVFGALFHENMLPYFVPLLVFDIWLQNDRLPASQRALLSMMPLGVTAFFVALLFSYGTHPFETAQSVLQMMQARSLDFDIRAATLEPMIVFPEERVGQLEAVWGSGFYRFRLTFFGGVGFLLMSIFVWLLLCATAHRSYLDRILLALVVISPISLLLVAFDVSRFTSIALLNVFLVITILARIDHVFRAQFPKVMTPVVFISLMVFQGHVALRDLNSKDHYLSRFPGALIDQKAWLTPD